MDHDITVSKDVNIFTMEPEEFRRPIVALFGGFRVSSNRELIQLAGKTDCVSSNVFRSVMTNNGDITIVDSK